MQFLCFIIVNDFISLDGNILWYALTAVLSIKSSFFFTNAFLAFNKDWIFLFSSAMCVETPGENNNESSKGSNCILYQVVIC